MSVRLAAAVDALRDLRAKLYGATCALRRRNDAAERALR